VIWLSLKAWRQNGRFWTRLDADRHHFQEVISDFERNLFLREDYADDNHAMLIMRGDVENGQGPDTTHTRSDLVVGAMVGIGDHVRGSNSSDNRASNLEDAI
jgi:hypothetical protein